MRKRQLWPYLRHCPGILLQIRKKTSKIFIQIIWSADKNLNPRSPKYLPEAPTVRLDVRTGYIAQDERLAHGSATRWLTKLRELTKERNSSVFLDV
jgi:hypothetical protein